MRRGIFLLAIAFLTVFAGSAAIAGSGGPEIRASVDKRSVFIGDRIRYTVDVSSDNDLEVAFPTFQGGKIGDFEIKDYKSRSRKTFFGRILKSFVYELTSYSVGKYIIPPIEIKYRENGKSSDWSLAKTPSIGVNVESVLPKNAKIYDIKDIKGPLSFYSLKPWSTGLMFLIIAAMIIAALFYFKRRKKIKLRLAHEIALDELDAIRRQFSTGSSVKEYHIAISDCIRRYIEARFNLRAPKMTTEEFLAFLKDSNSLVAGHRDSLNDFLKACDLVKFAKYEPTPRETEAVFETATKFVEETKEPVKIETHPK